MSDIKRPETWHRLTQVDRETKRAMCSICGPDTQVYLGSVKKGPMCATRARQWRRENRPEIQTRIRHQIFRLTDAGYDALLRQQGGRCRICQQVFDYKLYVDHDHACCPTNRKNRKKTCGECIRGLLCRGCNLGLGMFRDDTDLLTAAIQYLEAGAIGPPSLPISP